MILNKKLVGEHRNLGSGRNLRDSVKKNLETNLPTQKNTSSNLSSSGYYLLDKNVINKLNLLFLTCKIREINNN